MAQEAKPTHPKPRLGRGLSSLIADPAELAADSQQYQHVPGEPRISSLPQTRPGHEIAEADTARGIPIDQIGPNPYQPRKDFKAEELAELAQSIAAQGILQPLIVTRSDQADSPHRYLLVAGERRLRAARLAGLAQVPCVVKQASRQQMLEWALVENIQRTDLNAVERAQAYREYMDRFNLTQADASQRLGQARATVANYLRILDLCDEIQKMVIDGLLSFGHAKVLAGMAGVPDRQVELARRTAAEALSVRQLEQLSSEGSAGAPEGAVTGRERQVRTKPPYIRDLEEQLGRAVGTRVTILPGKAKHSGRIVLEYYSLDDFDRIAKSLGLSVES